MDTKDSDDNGEPRSSSPPPAPRRKPTKPRLSDAVSSESSPAPPPVQPTTRAPAAAGFLRPGGVDAPPTINGRKLGTTLANGGSARAWLRRKSCRSRKLAPEWIPGWAQVFAGWLYSCDGDLDRSKTAAWNALVRRVII